MRKIYSILLCAVVAAFCFSASAKTFTVKVTDPNQVYVIDPTLSNPITDFDENNSYTFDTANFTSTAINLSAISGNEIVSVLDNNGNSPVDSYISFPTSSCAILIDMVEDNATVTVTTREKDKTFITVVGDPKMIYLNYNYSNLPDDNGTWTIESTYSGSFNIFPLDGYMISSITDENGTPVTLYGSYANIYFQAGTTSTYTVEAVDLEASRTASFTVDIDGNPSDVVLSRASGSYGTVELTGASTVVKFNPQTETSFQIRHANYQKTLYSVKKNGEPVYLENSYSTTYYLQVADGDVVAVTPDFPDVDVPLSFSFVNEGTEGVISSLRIDNVEVSDWDTEGFSAKLGQNLNISFNNTDYNISEITLNGAPLSNTYSYSATLTSEEALAFVIDATPKPLKKVTVLTNNPGSFYMATGYNGSGTIYTFTEEETTIEVSNSAYSLYIIANDGYYVSAVEQNGNSLTYFSSVSVVDGDEIVVVTETIVRDKKLTLYLHPAENWASVQFTTGYTTSLERTFSSFDSSLDYGYTHFDFGDSDMPALLRAYRSDYSYDALRVYLNGELFQGQYGGYTFTALEDGDVIKAYTSEPASFSVNYTIANDVDVTVLHDGITVIENPSTHNVLDGTSVHISPAAAVLDNASAEPIEVNVNGEPLTADENGVFSTVITADTEIAVTASIPSGILDVETASGNASVYNLQGHRVGTAADMNRLPAGIYIVNGRKVRL